MPGANDPSTAIGHGPDNRTNEQDPEENFSSDPTAQGAAAYSTVVEYRSDNGLEATTLPREQISIDTKLLSKQRLESFLADADLPSLSSSTSASAANLTGASRRRMATTVAHFDKAFGDTAIAYNPTWSGAKLSGED